MPPVLKAVFTSDWTGPFDGRDLSQERLAGMGYRLFPWKIESDNPWWRRPLKFGEVGCTLAHIAAWRHAVEIRAEPLIMVLEDDVVLEPDFLERLGAGLGRVRNGRRYDFDLLYLGRLPLEPDGGRVSGFVLPGYSHCTFGYVLTRRAAGLLLDMGLEQGIVPIDEFLPAMYIDHPRPDFRSRFPRHLRALAFDPPVVRQLPKSEAGSDTEDSEFIEPWEEESQPAQRFGARSNAL
jgi:collagen beta-1,O-galactosyltransferase